jgi:hypothetical protein
MGAPLCLCFLYDDWWSFRSFDRSGCSRSRARHPSFPLSLGSGTWDGVATRAYLGDRHDFPRGTLPRLCTWIRDALRSPSFALLCGHGFSDSHPPCSRCRGRLSHPPRRHSSYPSGIRGCCSSIRYLRYFVPSSLKTDPTVGVLPQSHGAPLTLRELDESWRFQISPQDLRTGSPASGAQSLQQFVLTEEPVLAEFVAREEPHLDILLHRSLGDPEPLCGRHWGLWLGPACSCFHHPISSPCQTILSPLAHCSESALSPPLPCNRLTHLLDLLRATSFDPFIETHSRPLEAGSWCLFTRAKQPTG